MKKTLIFLFCLAALAVVVAVFTMNNNEIQAESLNMTGDAIITNIWLESFSKLDNIKDKDIQILVVDVGSISHEGNFLASEDEIKNFIKLVDEFEKTRNYPLIILPYSEINTANFTLSPEFFNNLKAGYKKLFDMGFDGAYVDIEPVAIAQRQDYTAFLYDLRNELGEDAIIALYSGFYSDYKVSRSDWEWDNNYLHKVCENSDVIVVPVYDTDFKTEEEYKMYVKMKVRHLSTQSWNCSFFFGIPTHKPYPELLENAYSAFKEESEKYENTSVKGIFIFSEWTIDSAEWQDYDRLRNFSRLIKLN